METLEVMKKQQISVSHVAYNMVISVLAKHGDIRGAFKVFNEVRLRDATLAEILYVIL